MFNHMHIFIYLGFMIAKIKVWSCHFNTTKPLSNNILYYDNVLFRYNIVDFGIQKQILFIFFFRKIMWQMCFV